MSLELLGATHVGGPVDDAIAAGNHDENSLTDQEFNRRHPERIILADPKIKPEEKDLAKEWLDIRDNVVRPALRPKSASGPAPVVPVPSRPSAVLPSAPSGQTGEKPMSTLQKVGLGVLGLSGLTLLGILIKGGK